MARKFKKDDEVIIMVGKDKGKKGNILQVLPKEDKVIVEGVNNAKKHKKPTQDAPGEIGDITRPIAQSNVMLICPKSNKPTRVGFTIEKNKKYRISKVAKEKI